MDFLISKDAASGTTAWTLHFTLALLRATVSSIHDIDNVGLGHTFDYPPTQCPPLRLLLPTKPEPDCKATCRTFFLRCRLIIISVNTATTVRSTDPDPVISNISIIAKCVWVCGNNVTHASYRPTNWVWAASGCRSCKRPDADAITT